LSSWNWTLSGVADPTLAQTFAEGGFYYVPLSNNLYVVVLNTVFYTPQDLNITTGDPDPAGQFQFLKSTLAFIEAAGAKAIIAQHVPQGANRGANPNFESIYETSMTSIIQQYASSIVAILCGHLHRDYLRMYYSKNGSPAVPILINGAITPQDYSNPSFTYFSYSGTTLQDYDKYYFDLNNTNSVWSLEYTLSQAYPNYGGVIDAEYINSIITQLKTGHSVLTTYQNYSTAGSIQPLAVSSTNNCFDICMAEQVIYTQFTTCMKSKTCHVSFATSLRSQNLQIFYLFMVFSVVLLTF
jgi:hypothetical protein